MFTKTRIFILILTLACFLVWLSADLIKTPASFTPDDATTKALLPLNSDFDQTTLDKIAKLNFSLPAFSKSLIKPPVIIPSPSPSPIVIPSSIPASSGSARLQP